MKALRIIFIILFNRYVIAIIAFAVWMIFFDGNSLIRQRILNERIGNITRMSSYYRTEIAKNEKAIQELKTNQETLEKYAREKYLMKRDNEDIYIIVRD
ncbi:MAG: septum formation initiator family protein [Bacteroidales bacterium]|nr:septum formation initiator family protein [Bacteroidales bacterium]